MPAPREGPCVSQWRGHRVPRAAGRSGGSAGNGLEEEEGAPGLVGSSTEAKWEATGSDAFPFSKVEAAQCGWLRVPEAVLNRGNGAATLGQGGAGAHGSGYPEQGLPMSPTSPRAVRSCMTSVMFRGGQWRCQYLVVPVAMTGTQRLRGQAQPGPRRVHMGAGEGQRAEQERPVWGPGVPSRTNAAENRPPTGKAEALALDPCTRAVRAVAGRTGWHGRGHPAGLGELSR